MSLRAAGPPGSRRCGASATRVSGAGSAVRRAAGPATENTRRSTCRGRRAPSTRVGSGRRPPPAPGRRSGTAPPRPPPAATASSAAEHAGPNTAPRPPYPATGRRPPARAAGRGPAPTAARRPAPRWAPSRAAAPRPGRSGSSPAPRRRPATSSASPLPGHVGQPEPAGPDGLGQQRRPAAGRWACGRRRAGRRRTAGRGRRPGWRSPPTATSTPPSSARPEVRRPGPAGRRARRPAGRCSNQALSLSPDVRTAIRGTPRHAGGAAAREPRPQQRHGVRGDRTGRRGGEQAGHARRAGLSRLASA